MKRSRAAKPVSPTIIFLIVAVILLPLGLTMAWGQHFAADSYTVFSRARNLASGAEIIANAIENFRASAANNVLYALLLSLPARIGIEPSTTALILSAFGWSAAALALLDIGWRIDRTCGAMVTALLLSFSPGIIATSGSLTSWIIALGWITLALTLRHRRLFALVTGFILIALLISWPINNFLWPMNVHLMAASWTLFLFMAGIGLDWLVAALARRNQLNLAEHQITTWLLASVFIVLAIWQVTRLGQAFQERPERYWRLEEHAAEWLREKTDASSLILANARIGYLTERPTLTAPILPTVQTAAALQKSLQAQPADYLVTTNELVWQQLQELNWFRLSYQPTEVFNDPSLPEAPITIWSFREPVIEAGQRHAMNARVPDRLSIVGYQIGPQPAQPGETVQMILYFQAPEATALTPVPFQAIVRLVTPGDGRTVSDWHFDLPQSVEPAAWQAGEVIVEQMPLKLPADLETGAYRFNLSLIGADGPEFWPISFDKDINRLDRIPVGGIIVPGEGLTEKPQPVDATFAEAIELTGFILNGPGLEKTLEVDLIWEASQDIEKEYTVFLHLLDSAGGLVASHDSQPDNGRFPTSSWLPGIAIPDRHAIELADDVPSGEYELKAGLYDPQTGQRLPVVIADSDVPVDNAVFLTTVVVP